MKYIKFFTIFLFSCNTIRSKTIDKICFGENNYGSITKLRDLTEDMQGKLVTIKGRLHIKFEDVAVYTGSGSNMSKALWLNFTNQVGQADGFINMDGKEVLVTGVFDRKSKGHFGAYFATLDSVFCLERLN